MENVFSMCITGIQDHCSWHWKLAATRFRVLAVVLMTTNEISYFISAARRDCFCAHCQSNILVERSHRDWGQQNMIAMTVHRHMSMEDIWDNMITRMFTEGIHNYIHCFWLSPILFEECLLTEDLCLWEMEVFFKDTQLSSDVSCGWSSTPYCACLWYPFQTPFFTCTSLKILSWLEI
jgi:hypothetical protein